MRADTLRPELDVSDKSRYHFHVRGSAVIRYCAPCETVRDGDGRWCDTPTPGDRSTSPTVTDSKWLPRNPKAAPTVQKVWEPESADFCSTMPLLRHCSEDEVVEVEFASLKQMQS